MEITGKQLIAGNRVQGKGKGRRATNPASATEFSNCSLDQRAEFFNACTEEIMAQDDHDGGRIV